MILAVKLLAIFVALAGEYMVISPGLKWLLFDEYKSEKPPSLSRQGVILTALGISALIALSGTAQIPATHVGVVENTWTGELFMLQSGTHIFPFEPRLWPLVTHVEKYDLRRQIIEIGGQPVKQKGVQADSNSPGRPVVYFFCRGWAYPNAERIVELHRRYGRNYLDDWVKRVWVSSLKAIQDERPYDFVENHRVEFQNLVERALQQELLTEDGEPLVYVSQLAVVDFAFSSEVDKVLD